MLHRLLGLSDPAAAALSSATIGIVVCGLTLMWLHAAVRQSENRTDILDGLARTDHLTGLPNRCTLHTSLPAAMRQTTEQQLSLVVALHDLDHFKRYNDTHGHAAGDVLLREAAATWSRRLDDRDILARVGGEEFLLVSRRGEREAADLIEHLRLSTPAGQSFSAGAALWDGSENAAHLISRADRALYVAKQAGRRRTEFAEVAQRAGRS